MGAGHASTSIGYAVGLKEAMRHGIGEDGKVVAVIGDGALTGGVAFEALHNAGGLQTPVVIVLNDNGMSISPNVGALSRYFNSVRLNRRLYQAREDVESRLTKLPLGLGRRIERLGPEIKAAVKAYWAPGLLFEELDLAYVGVVDGHDVTALRKALTEALAADRPVVVHIHTVKGKGFAPAEEGGLEGMEKWHAAKPGSIVDRAPAPKKASVATPLTRPEYEDAKPAREPTDDVPPEPKPPESAPQYTQVFADALVAEAKRDKTVLGITAAMAGGTGLQKLLDEVPEQYYDVGIAEQNAVLLAAGLAIQGAKPVCAIYSTFLQRAYDQIVHDVCLQELDVTFAMDRAGLVGDDGPTHHGAFDISYFRCLPNVVLMAPRDEAQLVHMLRTALEHRGPIALRYPRGAAIGVPLPEHAELLPIGTGRPCARASASRSSATASAPRSRWMPPTSWPEHGISATVADARFAKPLDTELINRLAADHELLVTIEDNVVMGGFGSGRARAPRGHDRPRIRPRPACARRPARPLRHPRQARAPARGGRADGRGGRRARAHRARGARAHDALGRRLLRVFLRDVPLHRRPETARGFGRLALECPGVALEYFDCAHWRGREDGSVAPAREDGDLAHDVARPGLGDLLALGHDVRRTLFDQVERETEVALGHQRVAH